MKLITFTNVFAHIEDLNGLLNSVKTLMSKDTLLVIENHYLGGVLEKNQFDKITKKEEITRVAQVTINNLCDYTRSTVVNDLDKYTGDVNAVNFISSTKINTYLLRKNRKLVHCVYIPLRNEGMEFLHELCHEEETEIDFI